MKRKILIAALATLGLSAMSSAQTAVPQAQKIQLTLEQAIDIALNDNPLIKVANLEIEKQDYVRKETIGNLYPNISGTASYNRTIIQQKMSRDGLSFGADNTIALTGNVSLPLFVPAVYANLKLNQNQLENAVESARSSKINLVNEVRKGYYNILLAEQALTVFESTAETIQQTVDNTKILFESGMASEYDYLTAQVQLSNMQPNIIQTKSSIDIAKMLLKMFLSLPQEIDIEVTGTLDEFSDRILYGNIAYTTDVSENSDLRILDIQERMLHNQIKLINSQRLPTVAAFGTASLSGNDMEDINFLGGGGDGNQIVLDPSRYPNLSLGQLQDVGTFFGDMMSQMMGGTKEPATGFWWQNPISAGIQISIPIFSGNRYVNQVRQTRNTISQLTLQRDYVEQSVKVQAQSAINNIMTAREKMFANQKATAQAQKAYDITDARYTAGASTILELNSAQMALTNAQLSYSQSIYDYLAAEADYEKTVGREYWNNQR